MDKYKHEEGTFENSGNVIKGSLSVYLFVDDEETHIAYSPALDLAGYGNTNEEAKESFSVVLEEYLHYTITHNTVWDDFKKYGWKHSTDRIQEPSLTYLLKQNNSYLELLNRPKYVKYGHDLEIPIGA